MEWVDDIGPLEWAFIFVFVIAVLVGAVVKLAQFIHSFSMELKHLNCEIRRTSGKERAHWVRLRRWLWLTWILFGKR